MREKDEPIKTMESLMVVLILMSMALHIAIIDGTEAPAIVLSEPPKLEALVAGIPHVPIVIDGDPNFNATAQAEGWSGNGTESNPYIIENLEIDRGGGPGNCISISNTRAHFVIRNCNLTRASADYYSGIYLNNVMNGRVDDNDCSLNYQGIKADYCNNNTLRNNTCFRNSWCGVWLLGSGSNILANNICDENGNGAGIWLEASSSGNIVANNTCVGNHLGGLWMTTAYSNTVSNNTCIGNHDFGIYCYVGNSNTITNNTCTYQGMGIEIEESSSNIVSSNRLAQNSVGIWLFRNTLSNAITNNTCSDNSIAIELESNTENNDILWNIFERSSGENSYDDGANNTFNYNYWSDYDGLDEDLDGIGDHPHPINGTVEGIRNQDPNPLIFPPGRLPMVWVEEPADRLVVWNESVYYDLNVTAYGGVDLWWLNDTLDFDVDQAGIIMNSTVLAPGVFGVQVFVNDTYGNFLSGMFSLTVVDTTPPRWSESPVDKILECGEYLHLDLNATDILLDTWWLNDTVHFTIDSQGLVMTTCVIPVGVYGVQVWVNDTSNNVVSATFTVTVIDTRPPVWIEGPQNQTIASGASLVCDLNATDPSGIAEWWIDDDVHFIIDWTGRVRTTGILEPGIYGLRVYVSDIYGHILWVAILVEVTTATILSTTTTTSAVNSQDGFFSTATFILGMEVGGAVAIVIAFAMLRRRAGELAARHDSG